MVLRFVEGLLKYRFLGTTKEFLLGRAGVGPNGHTLGITQRLKYTDDWALIPKILKQ